MIKDIILINPAKLRDSNRKNKMQEDYPYPPTGLLSMAGLLMMHGHEVEIIDFFRENMADREAFIERLKSTGTAPKLVGISAYTEVIQDAGKIAEVVRALFHDTKIVFGGPHATFCYDEILADFDQVDYVCRYEGEAVVVELLEHLANPSGFPLEEVAGLAYRGSDGQILVNESHGYIVNLDIMPFPPSFLIPPTEFADGSRILILLTSRGCPGACLFCASRALSGSAYRFNSADWILGLIYNSQGEFTSLGILDDTFLAERDRFKQIVNGLKAMEFDAPWTCKSRVDTLDEETIKLLRGAGCRSVHLGLESADNDVLRAIGKGITVAESLEVLFLLKKYGVRPECSFIIGHHADTKATIEKTIYLACVLRDSNVSFSVVGISTPLPGTPLHRHADKLKIRIANNDWRYFDMDTPIYDTENFSFEDLERARYFFEVDSKFGDTELALSNEDLSEFKQGVADFIERIETMRKLPIQSGPTLIPMSDEIPKGIAHVKTRRQNSTP